MRNGFTLVELMIMVAIIGILATAAAPTFNNTLRKSKEAMTKGNLGAMRSALSIYYSDNEGRFPTDDLTSLTVTSKYLKEIPTKSTPPFHPDGHDVSNGSLSALSEARGDWFYVSDETDAFFGTTVVNCTHLDLKGQSWSAY